MKKLFIALAAVVAFANVSNAQVAIKTNLLHWAAGVGNGGIEVALAPRWTISAMGYGNWWSYDKSNYDINGWWVNGELRYWFCEKFNGHHLGLYGGYDSFDRIFLDSKLFKMFGKNAPNANLLRKNATGFSMGLSWGYYLRLYRHWALDFNVGLGATRLTYDNVDRTTGQLLEHNVRKWMWDLSNIQVSLSYKF